MQDFYETLQESSKQKKPYASVTKRSLSYLIETISSSPIYSSFKKTLASKLDDPKESEPLFTSGIQGSFNSLFAASLFKDLDLPLLIISSRNTFDLYDNDLVELLGKEKVHTVSDELSPALAALSDKSRIVLLATFEDLLTPLRNPGGLKTRLLSLHIDQDIGYQRLAEFLTENHYTKKEFVEEEGEFSTRGSIIDIFPFGYRKPVRSEFFGDTTTSLRFFDVASQLSGEPLDSIVLTGNMESKNGIDEPDESWTLTDYLPPETLIVVDDASTFRGAENSDHAERNISDFVCIWINRLEKQSFDFGSNAQKKLHANFKLLARELADAHSRNQATVITTSSKKEIEELVEFVNEEREETDTQPMIEINWNALSLHSGFVFENLNIFTEADIFGKLHVRKSHKKRSFKGISLADLQKLKIGDYIVHEDYGIGVFKALETIDVGNSEQESVLVEYDRGDELYVNIQNIGLLSKYTAAEGSLPALSRLGSPKWKAKKEKVSKRLKDIASKLIKLYARRKMTPGFTFSPDSIFQKEFEAAFIFEETPDQLKTIDEVKKDMQSSSPMDRLICGDAGFGKTEIAMRAAFKAIESKKQVALLTPTTILAHQHAETFKKRFENFPVSIALLSRFISRKEQKELVKNISRGLVDIVIGTHRLVSKDVEFQDLGLLVIDEEQHFGVSIKEKLRQSFPGVDTLTLSATPIPRTLQFSMLGARDLSIVSTPPRNRQPVETVITQFDQDTLRSVIQREITRKGQVFFLHNRVSGLEQVRTTLQELVPEAKTGIAHGQMPTTELENVMMRFINHDLDILISTSIIGSGLDISNANTIIINRADMFGLSDLYQLRGRVGRSERKAFCYLIIPPVHSLKREALQRLAVIESFTELGSGFNIALRDLDIRGAGNLLGAEQSGAIHELGFDLYQKLLEQAVSELKRGEFSGLFTEKESQPVLSAESTDMVFYFDALIPDYYVSSTQERFSFYDKLSKSSTKKETDVIRTELRDRFGPLPIDVENLISLTDFKNLCSSIGLARVDIQQDTCTLHLPGEHRPDFYNQPFFQALVSSVQSEWMLRYQPRFQEGKTMKLLLRHPEETATDPSSLMSHYSAFLRKLAGN